MQRYASFDAPSQAYQDQVNRPAATNDRLVESPYRRVRLNAWLSGGLIRGTKCMLAMTVRF
jgi:hypothetical protein